MNHILLQGFDMNSLIGPQSFKDFLLAAKDTQSIFIYQLILSLSLKLNPSY
jgi:hypothetical protein